MNLKKKQQLIKSYLQNHCRVAEDMRENVFCHPHCHEGDNQKLRFKKGLGKRIEQEEEKFMPPQRLLDVFHSYKPQMPFCRSVRQICLTSTVDARLRSTGLSSPPAHCGARVWLCEAKFCCSTTKDLRSFGLKRKDVSFKKKESPPVTSHCLNYQWHERKKSFMSPLECVQDFQLHLPALKGWWSPAVQF